MPLQGVYKFMHPVDVNQALKSMYILVDTREQRTTRSEQRYSSFGCHWRRQKLNFGDYSAETVLPSGDVFTLSSCVCIERKLGLDELAHCYCQDRKRFEREFERAKESGAKVYLLIENGSWEDAYSGKYRSRMTPDSLVASIQAWLARYNCQIIFCQQQTTGRLIHDILYRELKEALEKYESDGGTD